MFKLQSIRMQVRQLGENRNRNDTIEIEVDKIQIGIVFLIWLFLKETDRYILVVVPALRIDIGQL